ncbi:MAG: Wzz/FepE/Etk N-terminal domain-containing protein [Bacteroidota bacterium]
MNKQTASDEITLKETIIKMKEWFSYLLSKWMIILFFALLGAALGLVNTYFKEPVYTAELSFALEEQQSGEFSGALGLASQLGFDLGGGGGGIFTGANLIELFKSRRMVEQTLLSPISYGGSSISFAEMYIRVYKWRDLWAKDPEMKALGFPVNANRQQFSRAQDSILGVIYESISKTNLKVEQKDKRVDIITIEMQSANEEFAKFFTEALAKEVSDFYVKTKSRKASMNMEILEKQTDSVRRELNSAITGVAIANDNTFGLNPALNVRRAPSARRQVDVQANTAILTELVKQTELARVVLRKETPLIQVIDRPILPLKKDKSGRLKSLIVGGLIGGFLIVLILLLRRIFKDITK